MRRRSLPWIAAALMALLPLDRPAADPLPRSVLVLDQLGPGLPWSLARGAAFRSTLRAESPEPISVYEETLDFQRFGDPQYKEILGPYFAQKYRHVPLGVIVTYGSLALDTILHWRDQFWPRAPVVFGSVEQAVAARLTLPPNATGSSIQRSFEGMLAAARAVVPNLAHVVILGSRLEQSASYGHFKEEIAVLGRGLDIIDLTGLAVTEVKRRVANLPPQTAIVYTPVLYDAAGVSYIPTEALETISRASNRPIVVDAETLLGHGTVGGFILSPGADGRAAARLVLRVLGGEDPSRIPVAATVAPRPIFDWRELQRWHIDEAQLPAGSEIRFRERPVWEQYRWQITAVATILVIQTALIVTLMYERARRRTAEALARAAEIKEMLMQELSHRMKNMMAIVQAIGTQSLRNATSLDEARLSFTARMGALAVAQDVLLQERTDSADLNDIVRGLAALHGGLMGRIKAHGPPLQLTPKATLATTLTLHELATNAAKYGALSNEQGTVAIDWDTGPAMGRDIFTLRWSEHGGPPVAAPGRTGFGSRLIERGFAGELNGRVHLAYEPTGLVCTMTAPLESVQQSGSRELFRLGGRAQAAPKERGLESEIRTFAPQ